MRIVFQGDSITDAGRNENNGSKMSIGQGYAALTAGHLMLEKPTEFEFFNRGVAGNKIEDMYKRMQLDCWDLCPDVISILIGVNNVWVDSKEEEVEDNTVVEQNFRMLTEETLKKLPKVKMIIMEPFLLKGSTTTCHWERFRREVEKRAASAQKISREFGQSFVPLQKILDELACTYSPEYWIADGVHPSLAGHAVIAREWLKIFGQIICEPGTK